jgi:hypothetical protein
VSPYATRRYGTEDETAEELAAYARRHGLAYEREGILPTASTALEPGDSPAARAQRAHEFLDKINVDVPAAMLISLDDRPHWAENLCSGTLPGGLEGTLAHYCAWYYHGGENGHWVIGIDTVVVAQVLEGTRVAQDMEGHDDWPHTIASYRPEYGPTYREVEIGSMKWQIPVEEDEQLVRMAIASVPAGAHITLRDGMIVAKIEGAQSDPQKLDQLCRTASAFADGLRAAARTLRPLTPGDPLPEPRSTPYRDWAKAGAARVTWQSPPPDLDTAVAAYAKAASTDPQVGKRRRRGRAAVFGLFAVLALFFVVLLGGIGAASGNAVPGALTGLMVGGVLLLIGAGIAVFMGRSAGAHETSFRQQVWALHAFAEQYANSRGLYVEDHDELRRRIPMPVNGSPQRVMRGTLPGGQHGRVVLWRDRNLPDRGFVNMAIVHAPHAPAAEPPYVATPTDGGWLVVCEWTDQRGRTAARLDAVAREASRLAAAAPLHR